MVVLPWLAIEKPIPTHQANEFKKAENPSTQTLNQGILKKWCVIFSIEQQSLYK